MKRNILKFFTTTILIGVVATSLILTSAAESVTKSLLNSYSYVYNGDGSLSTPATEVIKYTTDLNTELDADDSLVACPAHMYGQYDNYIKFTSEMSFGFSAVNMPHAIVGFNFGTFNTAAFNTIEFNVGMFLDPQEPGDPIYNIVVSVNGDLNYLDKTVIATQTDFKEYTYTTDEGVPARYRYATYNYQIIFNEAYKAGDYKITVEAKTFLPPFDKEITYYIGCDDLKCNYLSEAEIDTAIKNTVVNISNTATSISNKTTIISDDVAEIKDILSTTLTPEQMEKIDEGREFIEGAKLEIQDSAEADEEIRRVVAETFDRYNDIEYDLFGDRYIDHIENYVEPVYNNEGFRSFWDGLWSHSFIIAMCVTVVTFCAIGFALYGVR